MKWQISIDEHYDSTEEALKEIEAIFEEESLDFGMYHYGCYNWFPEENISEFFKQHYKGLKLINDKLENPYCLTIEDAFDKDVSFSSLTLKFLADLYIRVEFRQRKQTSISLYDYITKEKEETEPEGGLNS